MYLWKISKFFYYYEADTRQLLTLFKGLTKILCNSRKKGERTVQIYYQAFMVLGQRGKPQVAAAVCSKWGPESNPCTEESSTHLEHGVSQGKGCPQLTKSRGIERIRHGVNFLIQITPQ